VSSTGGGGAGVRTITLPKCADALWIQLNDFFELDILDAELLNEEGEYSLPVDYQN
jgi:hypothetical protein